MTFSLVKERARFEGENQKTWREVRVVFFSPALTSVLSSSVLKSSVAGGLTPQLLSNFVSS